MRSVTAWMDGAPMSRVLRDQAEHIPDAVFLLVDDESVTFGEADARVDAFAHGLAANGVGPASRVAVMMNNNPSHLWLTLALNRLGAVCVPVNTAFKSTYLAHVLAHAEADYLAIDDDYRGAFEAIAASVPTVKRTFAFVDDEPVDLLSSETTTAVTDAGSPRDLATILYTSGTTGPSKGAMMSNRYWFDSQPTDLGSRDVRDGDVFYVASPMFHAAAWGFIHLALMHGLTVAIDRRFSVAAFWDRVRHYRATHLFTMSAMHTWLWNAPVREDDADNPARVWGAVPLPDQLHEPFKRRFGVEHLWSTYGQTEAMRLTMTDVRLPVKPGSAGRARANVQLAVVDDEDRPVAPGQSGELVVRPLSPNAIMDGYWRMPEATLSAFRNLWYHTGDIVRIDADGDLFFLDRKNDYLRVRGENISSFELESSVAAHPEVAEVAAYAVEDDESGDEAVMIAVVRSPASSLTGDQLCAHCSEHVPRFAIPRYIRFVADLPRTPTNRVQKHLLRNEGVTSDTWERPVDRPTHRRGSRRSDQLIAADDIESADIDP